MVAECGAHGWETSPTMRPFGYEPLEPLEPLN